MRGSSIVVWGSLALALTACGGGGGGSDGSSSGGTTTTTPTVSISSGALSNSSTPVISGSATSGSTITLNIGGATYTAVATGGTWSINTASTPASGSLVLDTSGSNTVTVTARNAAGDSLVTTLNLVIDIVPPYVSVTTPGQVGSATPLLQGTAEYGSTITVMFAGAVYRLENVSGAWSIDTATAVPVSGVLSVSLSGSNTLVVTAQDSAGNSSTTATHDIFVENRPTVRVVGASTGYSPAVTSLWTTDRSTGMNTEPRVTSLGSDGRFVVAWTGETTAGSYSARLQFFNADGSTQPVTQVGLTPSGTARAAAIISAPGADGYMAFVSHFSDLYSYRSELSGNHSSKLLTTPDGAGAIETFSSAAPVGNSGTVMTAWTSYYASRPARAMLRKVESSAGENNTPLELTGSTEDGSRNQTPKVVALGGTGAYVVAWSSTGLTGSSKLYVQQFNADGSTTGHPKIVMPDAFSYQKEEQIALAALGNEGAFVVAWTGTCSSGSCICLQKFDKNGSMEGQAFVKAMGNGGAGEYPSLTAIGSQEEFALAWQSKNAGNGKISILAQKFNSVGTPDGYPMATMTDVGIASEQYDLAPRIAATGAEGGFTVLWRGKDAGGDYSIYVQAFDPSGEMRSSPVVLEAPGKTNSNDYAPTIVPLYGTKAFVVVWGSADTGNTPDEDVLVQKFLEDGSRQATIYQTAGGTVTAQASRPGTLYIVAGAISPSSVGAITALANNQWNSATVSTANSDTLISTVGLIPGVYRIYAASTTGELSLAAGNLINVQ